VNGWDVIYGITHNQNDTHVRAYTNRFGGGFHTSGRRYTSTGVSDRMENA